MAPEEKKKRRLQKKAPGAPKRGKSPYILFSMDKREEIKEQLPKDAKVTDVMKAIAHAWSQLNEEERGPWKHAAENDKQRYEEEMASYDGPLRVPNKRTKKHPDAPKRAACAFLYYSQVMRPRMKMAHPELKNTEISKRLGESWRTAAPEEREPYEEKERVDRARYKTEMEEWNAGKAERDYAERQQYHNYATGNISMFDSINYGTTYETGEV